MIDTKALRSRVLDLAIQGKLTEQLESDGTAEELWQQIQAEKQRLIKEGKLKKEKPLPEISEDEIPFEIPENWKWVRLKDICTKIIDGDHNPPKGVSYETDCMMLSAQNIINDRIDCLDKARYLTQDVFNQENERTKLCFGDILLTIVGTIGRSCVFESTEKYCFQRSVSVITTLIFNKYLKYAFDCGYSQKHMNDNATGAAQLGFYLNKLEKMTIPLPPLAEQKRIVARVEEIFRLLDIIDAAQEQYAADAESLKAKLITLGIQGRLTEQLQSDGTAEELYQQIQAEKQRLIKEGKLKKEKPLPEISEDEIPFEIPENWKYCYLNDIAYVTKLAGFEYTSTIAPNISTQGIPLFKGKNIQDGQLVLKFESFIPPDVSDALPRSQLRKKCLLTPYVGTIGNIAIFDGSFAAHLGSNVGKIELFNDSQQFILEEYVLLYLRSKAGKKQLSKFKKATAQDSISIEAIRNTIIPLPPLAEQKRIAETLERVLGVLS